MLIKDFMLRKMTPNDLDQVMEIEKQVFTLPWSRESYAGELNNSFANYLVVDVAGKVASYGGIWVVFREAHITNIAVHPEHQGLGYGKSLMLGLEQVARQKKAEYVYLEVRPSNIKALNLYEGIGYGQSGTRTAYYTDNNEDAIIMSKILF